ncbi:NAD(P)-binding protein [Wolfiporia cocos MD-104 SS10]|uniref:NAD(P)-binding protein n=1 Tax=Wolfiporia cocos (strain MD-104) TaxID=742152 RepID=A0A2H3JGA5_WOLCO|nr:NAD(P)-binding protein [Wolfiporia cocos MD-104 SS10]
MGAQCVKIRNAIWQNVEEANHLAPTFSRIWKEMILVSDPERPFIRTAKGIIQRKKTLGLYQQDIEQLYQTVEESRDSHGVAPPPSWNASDIQAWLLEHAAAISNEKRPTVDHDLFDQGFDSLSATFLRNRIIGALRESTDPAINDAATRVSQNFVFQYPTLVALAAAVETLVAHSDARSSLSVYSPTAEIDAMVAKYAAKLPARPEGLKSWKDEGAVVLLTGTTGSLGAHILTLLLADERVKRVYALNRGLKVVERQRGAFENAGLPVALLDSPKLVLLSGDLSREDFGLDRQVLDEAAASVTHIVHNAWRVDFNLALASFETHIAAAVRLLALAPGAHYVFTSSVSIAAGWRAANGRGPVPEKPLHNSAVAAKTSGYGMSKYVVEEVLAKAYDAGFRTTSLRIGQISGSSRSGAWNATDWVPSIIKSSVALGALPELDGVVSWLPMDSVAGATVDVMLGSEVPGLINVVHPRPVVWRAVASAVNEELGRKLEFVPLGEWVKRLEDAASGASAHDLETIPGIKLLEYFQSLVVLEREAREAQVGEFEVGGLPVFRTTQAQSVSRTLAERLPLGDEDARLWVKYWHQVRFLV